jgi:protein O-mannosyl-transferase
MAKKHKQPTSPGPVPVPPPKTGKVKRWKGVLRHLLALGLIAAVAGAVYSNTLHVPFVFDDKMNIVDNPFVLIKVLSWERLWQLVTNPFEGSLRLFAYLTFALNYYFGDLDPFGFHLVNLFVHIAAGCLVYTLVLLTLNLPSLRERYGAISFKAALFTGLLFVAHPVQTQAVTYIVQRMASMAALFYLLAMVLYVKGRQAPGRGRFAWYAGVFVAWVLGLLSKENVAILPLFIVLYEYYFIQDMKLTPERSRAVWILLGVVALAAVAGVALFGKKYFIELVEGYKIRDFTLGERLLTQSRVVLYYLSLLVFPHPSRLNLDYDFPVSHSLIDPPTTLIALLAIAALLALSVWKAKEYRLLSFSILWYFGNLAIESSIFPLEMVYEHRLYLPSVGPFLLFSVALIVGLERARLFLYRPTPVDGSA